MFPLKKTENKKSKLFCFEKTKKCQISRICANFLFFSVFFWCATFRKKQKSESFPFCGNTRVDFRNLARSRGIRRFTDPQKRTPNGNRCRLQGKPHFGTEMLLKPMFFCTFRMRTLFGGLSGPRPKMDSRGSLEAHLEAFLAPEPYLHIPNPHLEQLKQGLYREFCFFLVVPPYSQS